MPEEADFATVRRKVNDARRSSNDLRGPSSAPLDRFPPHGTPAEKRRGGIRSPRYLIGGTQTMGPGVSSTLGERIMSVGAHTRECQSSCFWYPRNGAGDG